MMTQIEVYDPQDRQTAVQRWLAAGLRPRPETRLGTICKVRS